MKPLDDRNAPVLMADFPNYCGPRVLRCRFDHSDPIQKQGAPAWPVTIQNVQGTVCQRDVFGRDRPRSQLIRVRTDALSLAKPFAG